MSYEGRCKGRSAIVTGGASGIGLAIASGLAEEGANVSLAEPRTDVAAYRTGGRAVTSVDHRRSDDMTKPFV